MRERERDRRLFEQRDDAERGLQRHRAGQDQGAGSFAPRAPGVVSMEHGREPDHIGHHAMIELNGERVLEEIAPGRLQEQQMRGGRDERAVDQRPGVVDQPGIEPGDQRAEINLQQHEHRDRQRGEAQPRRRVDGRCGAICCAVHNTAA